MQIRCKRSHAYTQGSALSLLADLTCWWAPKLCWLPLKPGLLFLLVPCSPHLPWKLQRKCGDLASRCRFSKMHTTLWQCVQVRYAGEPIFLINYVFNNIVTVTFHCGIVCFIPANRELIAPPVAWVSLPPFRRAASLGVSCRKAKGQVRYAARWQKSGAQLWAWPDKSRIVVELVAESGESRLGLVADAVPSSGC